MMGGAHGAKLLLRFPVEKLSLPSVSAPKVALLACGSFNPPTLMHLAMFDKASRSLQERGFHVCASYISPVHDAYGKKGLLSSQHRLEMCSLATSSSPSVMVDAWEANQAGYSKTFDVLTHVKTEVDKVLSERAPGSAITDSQEGSKAARVMLLCGADLLNTMLIPGLWEQPGNLLDKFGLVCLVRNGADLDWLSKSEEECQAQEGVDPDRVQLQRLLINKRDRIFIVELTGEEAKEGLDPNISSTLVRSRLKEGQPVKGLVHPFVEEYLIKHQLYTE